MDLRTNKFDKLLITQNSFLPRTKYANIKTKLPMISGYNSTGSSTRALNTHGKIGRLLDNAL